MNLLRATAGCLGDFLLWMVIVPFAGAFLALVFLEPGIVVASSRLVVGVILLIVVAGFVVLCTATVGYLRAQRAAIERLSGDEHGWPTEKP